MSTVSRFEAASTLLADARHYSRQIWLAGLGAYVKAGQESLGYLKELVQTGETVERKGKTLVSEKTEEVTEKLAPVVTRYEVAKEKVEEGFGKIEAAFDLRVARGLNRLGIASRQDVQAISGKLDVLSALIAAAAKDK